MRDEDVIESSNPLALLANNLPKYFNLDRFITEISTAMGKSIGYGFRLDL